MTMWPGWSNENTLVLPLDDAPPGLLLWRSLRDPHTEEH